MRIAIVHYHFKRGGVRTVVENACAALQDSGHEFLVLSGEQLADGAENLPESGAPLRVIPELAYGVGRTGLDLPPLLARLKQVAAEVLGAPPELWHIHNHSLGKNATLPLLCHALAAAGEPLLLQIHDFAEDGRPDNYAYLRQALGSSDPTDLGRALYPAGPHVHYACLNGRDAALLVQAGAAPGSVHLLPNAVTLEPGDLEPPPPELVDLRLRLYPTRAIRRKNLGEFLLLARLSQLEGARESGPLFAVTMAPANPVEQPIYQQWLALAEELRLPVAWEYGARSGYRFGQLLRGAERILTTSVGEGFGMAFLEPWLAGTPIAGRDLPDITRDFKEAGLRFPGLYSELRVPLEAAGGAEAVRAMYLSALTRAAQAYQVPLPEAELKAAWERLTADGHIDFGKLDEAAQARVLRADQALLEGLAPPPTTGAEELISANQRIIQANYGAASYATRLDALYQQAVAGGGGPTPPGGPELLRAFLEPSRFTPLRGVR